MRFHFFYPEHLSHVAHPYKNLYGQTVPELCDAFIIFGGDGVLLHAIQKLWSYKKPFYGMHHGTRGFLLNLPLEKAEDLPGVLAVAKEKKHPLLSVTGETMDGQDFETVALNDVCIQRSEYRVICYDFLVNGKVVWSSLRGDGILLCTAVGSTAYNTSIGGPIVHDTHETPSVVVVTPIHVSDNNAAVPCFRSHIFSPWCTFTVNILSHTHRPCYVGVDTLRFHNARTVSISCLPEKSVTLLLHPKE